MPGPDNRTATGEPPTPRSVREVIAELAQTEDALREWRTRTGRREVPVLDVHALLTRERELVAELRHLSGTVDATMVVERVEPTLLDGRVDGRVEEQSSRSVAS